MADFRKWFLVLAVMAAMVIPASAQTAAATCSFNSSPNIIRAEGLAETVGEIQLQCTNSTSDTVTTSFTAGFSAAVTSLATEAKLTVNGGSEVTGTRVGNTVTFNNVAIPTGPSDIRISHVRVNANASGAAQITATMSVTPPNVFFNNISGVVATVQTGLSLNEVTPGSLSQCVINTGTTIQVRIAEGFAAAFVAPGTGVTATRIFVRFTGIPANAVVGVPLEITSTASGTANLVGVTPAGAAAQLPDPVAATSPLAVSGQTIIPVTTAAVYEIATANDGVPETFTVPVRVALTGVAVTPPVPTVGAGFAPVTTSATVVPRFVDVSTTNAQPLFTVASCVTNLLFPFVTNKANFDTGIALINTSLDNAGDEQPFNTTPQSGTCTVYYFDGTDAAPAPQTTESIAAGAMTAFTLSAGGVPGSTSSAALFQGYIIARCNFQYAHGFAFITDNGNSARPAQGYLALVIPDRGVNADGISIRAAENFTTGGKGEQLAY